MARTHSLEHLMRQRLATLGRWLPAARNGHARSLHQARVATRRLREALPLVASKTRRRRLERVVRRIRRALGPVRELDVALQMLDDLRASKEAPTAAISELKRVILDERSRLHAEMLRGLERCDIQKLRKRALAAGRQPARRGRVRDARQLTAARERAARRAVRLQTAIENAAGLYLPDRLHEVRVAVKKLRYALELSSAVSGSRARTRIETLRRSQDLLGRMNDLEVLIARTRGVQGSGSAPNLKLSAEMDRLVRRLETECRRLHSQYIASRKLILSICDRTIAQSQAGSARAA